MENLEVLVYGRSLRVYDGKGRNEAREVDSDQVVEFLIVHAKMFGVSLKVFR